MLYIQCPNPKDTIMTYLFQQEGGEGRIKETALALYGSETEPANFDVLYRCALSASLAMCCRDDIPHGMEEGVAFVLARLLQEGDGRPVSSIRRGDVSITYDKGAYGTAKELLAPYVKLGRLQ